MFSPIRFIQIGIAVYGHLFWWILVRAGLWRSHLTPAQKFSRMLEKLGTPFVKLGQGLSMHTEFLPDDYVAALTSLQDHVAPFPGELAVHEIERSFGRNLDDLFAEFDTTPLGSDLDCTSACSPFERRPHRHRQSAQTGNQAAGRAGHAHPGFFGARGPDDRAAASTF